MQIGELAGLAVGATVLLNVMFAGYVQTNLTYLFINLSILIAFF